MPHHVVYLSLFFISIGILLHLQADTRVVKTTISLSHTLVMQFLNRMNGEIQISSDFPFVPSSATYYDVDSFSPNHNLVLKADEK